MQRAEILLDDFNDYRFKTNSIHERRAAGEYVSSVGATPKSRPKYLLAFERMAVWCEAHGHDPRRWLHSLFIARHWLFAPKLNQLTSARHLKRYAKMEGQMPVYRERIAAEQHAVDVDAGRVFEAARDISYTAETLKTRYARLGRPGRCMELMEAETFGFHPQSKTCGVCPLGAACEAMLQGKVAFDIQAVRRGELSLQQARVMAAYSGGR